MVCGYIYKDNHMISVILGQYDKGQLIYKGHVTLGVGGDNFRKTKDTVQINTPTFMDYTSGGGMRQPVFKGLRFDKRPEDCIINNNSR